MASISTLKLHQSPQKKFPSNTRVCAFIDEDNSCWLEDRIRDEFLPHEACSILSLPLSHHCTEDKLIWAATKNGIYSTKSANQLLHDTAKIAASGPSNRNAHKNFWQSIWSLNVPSKIRHFIWRACNDSLPTKQNLSKRIPTPNALCERCCCEIGDSVHALWGCQMLKEIWDLFHGIMLLKSYNLAETGAFIAWSIWFNRNALRVGSPSLPVTQIHRDALEWLQEFQVATNFSLPVPAESHPTHWLPPLPQQFKANCDGALFHGIKCADVVFEGDPEVVFKHLTAAASSWASFGHITDEACALALNIRAASFSHVKRSGNAVADKLARLA
nr:hypothetical protein CFP56_23650 [Quercus suber]